MKNIINNIINNAIDGKINKNEFNIEMRKYFKNQDACVLFNMVYHNILEKNDQLYYINKYIQACN